MCSRSFTDVVLIGFEESQDLTPNSDPLIRQAPATAKIS